MNLSLKTVLAVLWMMGITIGVQAAAPPSRTVFLSPVAALAGEQVPIEIIISEDLIGFAGGIFDLHFPPELGNSTVTLDDGSSSSSISLPDHLLPQALVILDARTPGWIRLGLMASHNNTSGGRLAEIPFLTKPNLKPGTYSFDLQAQLVSDTAFFVEAQAAGGTLTILSPASLGDVNRDGVIDIRDVTFLLRIYLELETPTPEEFRAGDVRPKPGLSGRIIGDNQINGDDLNWLLRRVLGLETQP